MAGSKSRVTAGRIVEEELGAPTNVEKKGVEKPLPRVKTIEEFFTASGISGAKVSKCFNDPNSARKTA
ncbi:MAG: hypothetical protein ABSF67_24585 [Roseiarcus sp.]